MNGYWRRDRGGGEVLLIVGPLGLLFHLGLADRHGHSGGRRGSLAAGASKDEQGLALGHRGLVWRGVFRVGAASGRLLLLQPKSTRERIRRRALVGIPLDDDAARRCQT